MPVNNLSYGTRDLWLKLVRPGYESDVTRAFSQKPFLNDTVVDDIFHWGESYNRLPPVFPMVSFKAFSSLAYLTSNCSCQSITTLSLMLALHKATQTTYFLSRLQHLTTLFVRCVLGFLQIVALNSTCLVQPVDTSDPIANCRRMVCHTSTQS